MTTAPARARQSYRHEAFLWGDRSDFVAGLLPFVRDGLAAGEAVMVALIPEHAAWLRAELGALAPEVEFVDMAELGHNPARIIPAWLSFLAGSCGRGRPARGVGEPVWPGRTAEEIHECQLHEALLNLAVDPLLPFWLLCPYDAQHLDVDVLEEVGRSHPALVTATSYEGSAGYQGHEHARELFTAQLPSPPARSWAIGVTQANVAEATEQVTRHAASHLASHQVVRLSEVVRGLVDAGLRRGSARVGVQLWDEPGQVVCQVSDRTVVEDYLVGRRLLASKERNPLWVANQACDLVQVRSGEHGTTVRLHMTK